MIDLTIWKLIFANSSLIECIYVNYRWFHGSITRDEAEHLLQPREDGLFLVRESTNFPGDYTLCVCFQGKVEHYRVKYLENKLTIDDEEYFENLGQLVDVSVFTASGSFLLARFLVKVLFAIFSFLLLIMTSIFHFHPNSIMKKMRTVCARSWWNAYIKRANKSFALIQKSF